MHAHIGNCMLIQCLWPDQSRNVKIERILESEKWLMVIGFAYRPHRHFTLTVLVVSQLLLFSAAALCSRMHIRCMYRLSRAVCILLQHTYVVSHVCGQQASQMKVCSGDFSIKMLLIFIRYFISSFASFLLYRMFCWWWGFWNIFSPLFFVLCVDRGQEDKS